MTNGERMKLLASGAWKVLVLMLYVIGAIGGTGNLFYYGEYVCAAGVAATGVLAGGKALDILAELISGD